METALTELSQRFLSLVAAHAAPAYALVFLISFLESLAFFGIVMPGALLMFGVGVIIANGVLGFHPTALAAALGAICGDGVSYWLGRRYQNRLAAFWPFSRHPKMLADGRRFFQRHGGKSLLFGRFIGPIRPVAPLVGGMLGVSPLRFAAVDVPAALAWAYAYLLPGLMFGASLTVSKTVSTRLTVIALALVVIVWVCLWVLRRLAFLLEGRKRRGDRLLFLSLVGIAVTAALSSLALVHSIRRHGLPAAYDLSVHHLCMALATPWSHRLFGWISGFGDNWSYLGLFLAVLAALLTRRCYRSAGFWSGQALSAAALLGWLKALVQSPPPPALSPELAGSGFPSGHVLLSAALLGFLGVLLARGRAEPWRWAGLGTALVVSLLIGLSRLLLGLHWPTDVLGGLALGWLLTACTGLLFLLTGPETFSRRRLALAACAGCLAATTLHRVFIPFPDLVAGSTSRTLALSAAHWIDGGWQELPGWRMDLGGEQRQPILLQWAGSTATLRNRFLVQGWMPAPEPDLKTLMLLLAPTGQVGPLPVLPRFHDGRPELLRLQREVKGTRWVLRLWPSERIIAGAATPIAIGSLEVQTERRVGPWLTLPAPAPTTAGALPLLIDAFSGWAWFRCVHRNPPSTPAGSEAVAWDGFLLLAAEQPPTALDWP